MVKDYLADAGCCYNIETMFYQLSMPDGTDLHSLKDCDFSEWLALGRWSQVDDVDANTSSKHIWNMSFESWVFEVTCFSDQRLSIW